ncbi:hypothetical protein [Lysobacter firmicutimachus]|uniref:Uncharacterized protein n=1 Tax=Lysobacter firmicutimachus TaxID=1792846 RepID=A0ABU8D7N4_9GAMM
MRAVIAARRPVQAAAEAAVVRCGPTAWGAAAAWQTVRRRDCGRRRGIRAEPALGRRTKREMNVLNAAQVGLIADFALLNLPLLANSTACRCEEKSALGVARAHPGAQIAACWRGRACGCWFCGDPPPC